MGVDVSSWASHVPTANTDTPDSPASTMGSVSSTQSSGSVGAVGASISVPGVVVDDVVVDDASGSVVVTDVVVVVDGATEGSPHAPTSNATNTNASARACHTGRPAISAKKRGHRGKAIRSSVPNVSRRVGPGSKVSFCLM